jgi:hypothetical protein
VAFLPAPFSKNLEEAQKKLLKKKPKKIFLPYQCIIKRSCTVDMMDINPLQQQSTECGFIYACYC